MKKTEHPLYCTWRTMHERCSCTTQGSYYKYGGRGISVDPRWDDFETFVKDMGDKPSSEYSLDRIDNDDNYSPENCRWATKEEQQNNRRDSILITLGKTTKTVSQWSEHFGVNRRAVYYRIGNGMLPFDALALICKREIGIDVEEAILTE
jgi:hypothetical protein